MEGVVDHHMRHILSSIGGIDYCVTEFVRVCDLTLPRKVFVKASPELIEQKVDPAKEGTPSFPTHCPTRVQLLGSNPQSLARNARKAAMLGAPGIDLNFGCPAKTVNKSRGGACLLNETALLSEIVHAVREAVPSHVPVTAKIRLGYEDRTKYLENALAIEKAGANELFVHARSKADGYKPPAYWDYIGDINKVLKIPVIANGEIWNLDDFKRCKEQAQSTDFMIGRGLLARPDLALAIKNYCQKENYEAMPWDKVLEKIVKFFYMTCNAYPQKYMGNRLKQWLFYLKVHYPEAEHLFNHIKRLRDFDSINKILTYGVTINPEYEALLRP